MQTKVAFFRPELREPEIEEVVAAVRSGWLTTGPRVKRFEGEFAAAVRAPHAVAMNSCTAALHLAVHALRLMGSGLFDKHPKLQIIIGHMGEGLPFYLWRISYGLRGSMSEKSFRDIFCEHFWITTSGFFSDPALVCCMMEMGIDRILFSVDYPFVENKPGTDWVHRIPLCAEDKAKIASGNAVRLLKL